MYNKYKNIQLFLHDYLYDYFLSECTMKLLVCFVHFKHWAGNLRGHLFLYNCISLHSKAKSDKAATDLLWSTSEKLFREV